MKVLLSDQHGHDDCAERLRQRYAGHENIRVLANDTGGDWVANINVLIKACETEFFRILPHDDMSGLEDLAALHQALLDTPDAVLSFGPVHAETLEGEPLPARNELNLDEAERNGEPWDRLEGARLFSTGRFSGAFKGLVRAAAVRRHRLWIERTDRLIHSERAWLAGLAFVGRFTYAPRGGLRKRYHPDSTHAQWNVEAADFVSTTRVMINYANRLLENETDRFAAEQELTGHLTRRLAALSANA